MEVVHTRRCLALSFVKGGELLFGAEIGQSVDKPEA